MQNRKKKHTLIERWQTIRALIWFDIFAKCLCNKLEINWESGKKHQIVNLKFEKQKQFTWETLDRCKHYIHKRNVQNERTGDKKKQQRAKKWRFILSSQCMCCTHIKNHKIINIANLWSGIIFLGVTLNILSSRWFHFGSTDSIGIVLRLFTKTTHIQSLTQFLYFIRLYFCAHARAHIHTAHFIRSFSFFFGRFFFISLNVLMNKLIKQRAKRNKRMLVCQCMWMVKVIKLTNIIEHWSSQCKRDYDTRTTKKIQQQHKNKTNDANKKEKYWHTENATQSTNRITTKKKNYRLEYCELFDERRNKIVWLYKLKLHAANRHINNGINCTFL